jgi:hypothetical protein
MADIDRSKTTWTYTTDQGETYSFNALTGYTGQAAVLGGTAWAGAPKPLPRGFRPRHAVVKTAAGAKRKVVCYDNDATAYTTVDTVVNVGIAGTSTAAAVKSMIGEYHLFQGKLGTYTP